MEIYWLSCKQQLVLICGFIVTCLGHQEEEMVCQHCIEDTSLQFIGLSRLLPAFIGTGLDSALSSESAHAQPIRVVNISDPRKYVFFFNITAGSIRISETSYTALKEAHAFRNMTRQSTTHNSHSWSILLCRWSFEPGSYLVYLYKWGQQEITLMQVSWKVEKSFWSRTVCSFFLAKTSMSRELILPLCTAEAYRGGKAWNLPQWSQYCISLSGFPESKASPTNALMNSCNSCISYILTRESHLAGLDTHSAAHASSKGCTIQQGG